MGKDCLEVNRKLIWPKAMFLWLYMSNAFYVPFVSVYLRNVGFSNLVIGTVFAIRPFLGFVSSPFWGFCADRSGKHKLVLVFVIIVTGVTRLSLLLMDSQTMILIVLFGSDFFGYALEPMVDSTVLEMLHDSLLFGKQRLWGAIGWGWVGAPLAGVVLSECGIPATFCIHAVLLLITLLTVLQVPVKAPASSGSGLAVLSVVWQDRRTLLFFLTSIVMGQAFGITFSFFFIFLADLGDKGLVMGISLLITCVVEVPVLYCASAVVKRIGFMSSVFVCLVATMLRFAFWGAMTNPWSCLIVEGLHGIMFGLMWSTGVAYARKVAPNGMGATMQGFYTGWMFGAGAGSGALICGAVASQYGLRFVFNGMAVYAGMTALLIPVLYGLGLMGQSNKAEDSFYETFDGEEMMDLEAGTEEKEETDEKRNRAPDSDTAALEVKVGSGSKISNGGGSHGDGGSLFTKGKDQGREADAVRGSSAHGGTA